MSHIKTIEIKNFKSIRHQKIEDCRRVNVFIGYPNVGKSNILEALGLYSALNLRLQSFRFNEICRVKHFSELYFNQDTRETNNIIINNQFVTELIINEINNLEFRINRIAARDENSLLPNLISATVNTQGYDFIISRDSKLKDNEHFIGLIKKYEFQKDININAQRPRALAVPNGNNLLDVLLSNSELRKEIIDIFKGYGLRLNIDRLDESIKFQKELEDGSTVTIPYHQIADTLKRLIFYKAAIQTNSNSVLLFEEPEAHMFPPYIRKMTADIMFDKNDNQYFIATHSPYVLDELVEELEDDLSVYLVDYKDGETKIIYLSREDLREVRDYGVDLFFNIESYLRNGQVHNA